MLGVDLWHEAGGGVSFCFERALPKKLGETSVSVAGVAAPVKYVSAKPGQLLVPFENRHPSERRSAGDGYHG